MKKSALVFLLLILSFSCSNPRALAAQEGSPPKVLVSLAEADSITVTVPFKTSLQSFDGTLISLNQGNTVKLSMESGKVCWEIEGGSSGTIDAPFFIKGFPESGDFLEFLSADGVFKGLRFAGDFWIMIGANRILLSNLVDLEMYTASVVASEMSSSWPSEALKAQAVVARTFALYRCMDIEGFEWEDVKLSSQDQLYKGVDVLSPQAEDAARSTYGLVMSYDNQPASVYYHADAGGVTEEPCFVWGGEIPYLSSVQEIPYESPYSSWTVSKTAKELGHALGISACEDILPLQYGLSGRWSQLLVRGGGEDLYLKANDFRSKIGLRSLLFTFYKKGAGTETSGYLCSALDTYVLSGDGLKSLKPKDIYLEGRDGLHYSQETNVALSVPNTGELTFVFNGKGWGHGVGLSQWGAAALADEGALADEILLYYYPKLELEKWY